MNSNEIVGLLTNPVSLIIAFLYLVAILIYVNFSSNSIENLEDRRDYRFNFYHKLFFAGIFGVYYLGIFQGGDTYAYYSTMEVLQNLLLDDFSSYWTVVSKPPSMEFYHGIFNFRVGYPPRFIYIEEESFNVTKFFLPLKLITFNSYLALTFLASTFMAISSWKIYKVAQGTQIFNPTLLKIMVLYLPSVAFWCGGVSKDMLVYTSLMFCVYYLFSLLRLNPSLGKKIVYIIGLLFFSYIIYRTRPFILYPLLVPVLLMYASGIINKLKTFAMLRVLIKGIIYTTLIGGMLVGLAVISANQLLESSDSFNEAVVIQQDFKNNKAVYGADDSKRYELHIADYSPAGIIRALPLTIMTGIYRPFLWESLTPSLIFNGIESTFFIVLTCWFLFYKVKVRFQALQANELLSFALGFVIVFAFIAGFTSILFGVLVRIRAPLLPFLGLILAIDYKAFLTSTQETILNEANEGE